MTRAQQSASWRLEQAQRDYLIAYGWTANGKLWEHPKLKSKIRYTIIDALLQTRAEPTLGWP